MKNRAPFEVRPGEQPPPSSDPLALLNYALAHGSEVQIINFAGSVREVQFYHPAGFEVEPDDDEFIERSDAELRVEVPLEAAENLAGPPGQRDAYILIHIDRRAIDAMDEPRLLVLPPRGLVRPS
jgi:hypothetical protein